LHRLKRGQKAPTFKSIRTTGAEEGLARRGIEVLKAGAAPIPHARRFTREVLADLKKEGERNRLDESTPRSERRRKRTEARLNDRKTKGRQRRIEAREKNERRKAKGKKAWKVASILTQMRERRALRTALQEMLRSSIKERARTPHHKTKEAQALDDKIARLQRAITRLAPPR
jgi:hypothetical protein